MKPITIPPDGGLRLNVLTESVIIRLSGADTGGKFTLVELDEGPGGGVPMHVHGNEDETFHVLEGEFEFSLADRSFKAGPGTTVFLPRDIPHAYKSTGANRNRALMMAAPAGIENMFADLAALPPGPPDPAAIVVACARHNVKFL